MIVIPKGMGFFSITYNKLHMYLKFDVCKIVCTLVIQPDNHPLFTDYKINRIKSAAKPAHDKHLIKQVPLSTFSNSILKQNIKIVKLSVFERWMF